MKDNKVQKLIVTAFFAALIGIFAQITIPLPLIPITGQTLAIGLTATIIGKKYGTLSVLVYIFLGIIGIPLFSHMTSGIGIILGPTGGYIIGFIPTAYIIGLYLEKTKLTFSHAFIANSIGMIITLCFGTTWLKYSADLSWIAAVISGALPFLIVGLMKAIIAAYIGVIVKKRLLQAKLIIK